MTSRFSSAIALAACLLAVAGCASSAYDHPSTPVPQAPVSVRDWGGRYSTAARALAAWVKDNDEDASQVLRWTSRHPEDARELLDWAEGHPTADADEFLKSHSGWKPFRNLMDNHESAVDGFLKWSRKYPEAARDFLTDSEAVLWTGDHPVAAYWSFERPRS
ncbi:MAG: hypothetical protein HY898_28790 [Deltaproteobacteria bacterium]|nr:hypothetical protein [Deltaproteobacteria bacterium]